MPAKPIFRTGKTIKVAEELPPKPVVQRPIDQDRMKSLAQPKPKAEDPDFKPEVKKRVSKLTKKQLADRANRVKQRQSQAFNKVAENAPVITKEIVPVPTETSKINVLKKL